MSIIQSVVTNPIDAECHAEYSYAECRCASWIFSRVLSIMNPSGQKYFVDLPQYLHFVRLKFYNTFLYWYYLWNENKRVRWNLYFDWYQNNRRKGFYVKWKKGEREQGNGETERERACVYVHWSKPTIVPISIHNSIIRETHLWGYQMVSICD